MHRIIAKIESTHLGYEDHGIFSLSIGFTFGSSAQGTGHFAICSKDSNEPWDACGIHLIRAIMDACGVEEWSRLKGRTVYALKDSEDWNEMIRGIEPLETENGKRVIFREIFDAVNEKVPA